MTHIGSPLRAILVATIALLAASRIAHAAVLSYTGYYPDPTGYTATSWSDGTATIAVPKFDIPNADLQSVSVVIGATLLTQASITNRAAQPAKITLRSTAQFWALPPDYDGVIDGTSLDNALGGVQATTGIRLTGTAASGATLSFPWTTVSVTSNSGNVTGDLSAFEGSGNVIFDVASLTMTTLVISGGNFAFSQSTMARAWLTITYEYADALLSGTSLPTGGFSAAPLGLASLDTMQDVTEPAACGAFLFGLTALARLRRRRAGRLPA